MLPDRYTSFSTLPVSGSGSLIAAAAHLRPYFVMNAKPAFASSFVAGRSSIAALTAWTVSFHSGHRLGNPGLRAAGNSASRF